MLISNMGISHYALYWASQKFVLKYNELLLRTVPVPVRRACNHSGNEEGSILELPTGNDGCCGSRVQALCHDGYVAWQKFAVSTSKTLLFKTVTSTLTSIFKKILHWRCCIQVLKFHFTPTHQPPQYLGHGRQRGHWSLRRFGCPSCRSCSESWPQYLQHWRTSQNHCLGSM